MNDGDQCPVCSDGKLEQITRPNKDRGIREQVFRCDWCGWQNLDPVPENVRPSPGAGQKNLEV